MNFNTTSKASAASLVQGALLITVTLILQSLRLIIPMPTIVSAFIIGILVHMMLTLTIKLHYYISAIILCVLLPFTAYFQGQLAFIFLIPIIILGNLLFIYFLKNRLSSYLELLIPPLIKASCMSLIAYITLQTLNITQASIYKLVIFSMSVPQLITGIVGILLARKLLSHLKKVIFTQQRQ